MDVNQLTKLVTYIDEERRKDRAMIMQMQERVDSLLREVEARTRYAQSLETALNELKLQIPKAMGWTTSIEQVRGEFSQVIERIEDQRTKSERELVRMRQIEIESIVRQLNELKKEIKPYASYAEHIEARKVEEGRLAEMINQVQVQLMELERRFDPPTAAIAYLEEQRRQDTKRIVAVEQEIPDLKKKLEQFPPKLLLLDEAIRRKQTDIEEAAKVLEAQNQLIESQRISDVRRERQFAEYAEIIEKLKVRAEEVAVQVTGYVQMREEVRRELVALPDFYQRIEVRVNEIFEVQRDAEERAKRVADAFREQIEKEWRMFAVSQDEKWHERDRRISEYEPRITEVEEEQPKFQPQINALYEVIEAFCKAYAQAGRDWLGEANVLLDKAKTTMPSEIKPSRRQRRKQQAQLVAQTKPNEDGADLQDDLVE